MLVLARKLDQSIQIGDDITLTIVAVKGNTVRIGISAPDHVRITRSELQIEPQERRPAGPFKPQAADGGAVFRPASTVAPPATERRGGLGLTQRGQGLRNRRPSDLARSAESHSGRQPLDGLVNEVVELKTRPDQPVAFRTGDDRLTSPGEASPAAGLTGRQGGPEAVAELYEVQHLRVCIDVPNVAEATQR